MLKKKTTWFMKYVISVSTKVQRRRAPRPTPSDFNLSHNDHATVEGALFVSIQLSFCGVNWVVDWTLHGLFDWLSVTRLSATLLKKNSLSPAGCLCEVNLTKWGKVCFQLDDNYPRRVLALLRKICVRSDEVCQETVFQPLFPSRFSVASTRHREP